MDERAGAFRGFFLKNTHGKDLLAELYELIDSYHRESEKKPETARDNAQKSAGVRDIINKIETTVAVRKGEVT